MHVSDLTARLAYSYRQAGELIGCCPKTIYNEVRAGRLRAIKVGPTGRLPRILAADLQKYLDQQRGAQEVAHA